MKGKDAYRSRIGDYISLSHKNTQVAEVNEVYTSEEKNNTIVRLMNLGDPQDYSITMVYDIQPL
jgi:hypothetical protein